MEHKNRIKKFGRGVLGVITVWSNSNGVCQRCGIYIPQWASEVCTIGHRESFAVNQNNDFNNIGIECRKCNVRENGQQNDFTLLESFDTRETISNEKIVAAFFALALSDYLYGTSELQKFDERNKCTSRSFVLNPRLRALKAIAENKLSEKILISSLGIERARVQYANILLQFDVIQRMI